MINGQGFRQANIGPDGDNSGHYRHREEDQVPFAKQHDQLSRGRRYDWQDHENHHDKRHDFSHLASGKAITHDGNGNDTCCCGTQPL